MMFGSIVSSGIQMISACGFSQRNIIITSLSLAVGIGFTTSPESEIWKNFPPLIQTVFGGNVVAVVFVVALLLNGILPKNMESGRLPVQE